MSEVIWESPGPPRVGTWIEDLTPLMLRPGDWQAVRTMGSPESARSTVYNLREGRQSVPDGRWDFRADGAEVFAVYLGPAGE